MRRINECTYLRVFEFEIISKEIPQIGNIGKNNLNTNQRLDGGALQPTSLVVIVSS